MTETKRKPGRPGRPRTVGERVPLGLRVTPELKAKLDSAAKDSGRSQSQEVELRLEQSLRSEGTLYEALDLAYGRELTAVVLTLARALHFTGTRTAFVSKFTEEGIEKWMSNPYAFDQAISAANVVLEAFRPEGKVEVPTHIALDFSGLTTPPDKLGRDFGKNVLAAVERPPQKREEWARPIAERLAKSEVKIRIKQERTAGGPKTEN
ncbi:MAG: TraY domain-containing protein [Proteobacteria bacterium]|nr:TraY domain-containing protein [Pseudomonadota bacterium]